MSVTYNTYISVSRNRIEVAVDGIMRHVKKVKPGTLSGDNHSCTVSEAASGKFAAIVAKRRQI